MSEPAAVDALQALEGLEARIRGYGAPAVVVAFSGGVDSAVVLAASARALGPGSVTAVTALSPSYPAGELEQARDVAASLGVGFRSIETREVDAEAYARNDAQRCYHCKTELYTALRGVAAAAPAGAVVLAGANADDLEDFRPGLRAASEHGVRNPLVETSLGKERIRAVARLLGLSVADKPAMACLSSRVAFGVRIDPGLLARIDRAERMVRDLGFDPVRVRHHGDAAVVEVGPGDVGRLQRHPALAGVMGSMRALGWGSARVDPRGYRPGSMNATLVNLSRKRVTSAG